MVAHRFGGLGDVNVTTFQSLSGRGDARYDRELVVSNVYPLRLAPEPTERYIGTELELVLGKPSLPLTLDLTLTLTLAPTLTLAARAWQPP